MVRSKENLFGAYAFTAGVVLAIIIGLIQTTLGIGSSIPYIVLVILGLMIGFSRVGDSDSMTFLLASTSLVIVSGMGQSTLVFISNINSVLSSLSSILQALLVMFVPATIAMALKTVFSITNI
jgi:hypothetical protein